MVPLKLKLKLKSLPNFDAKQSYDREKEWLHGGFVRLPVCFLLRRLRSPVKKKLSDKDEKKKKLGKKVKLSLTKKNAV